MPAIARLHDTDPKAKLREGLDPYIKDIEPLGAAVLLAVYIPPEKTKGGIFMTEKHRDENKYQGVAGLVMKMGPLAFKDDKKYQFPIKPKVGDWVLYRPGDTYGLDLGDHTVRFIEDILIKAILTNPDVVA